MATLALDLIQEKLKESEDSSEMDLINEDFNIALNKISNEFLEIKENNEESLNIDVNEIENPEGDIPMSLIESLSGAYAIQRVTTELLYNDLCKLDVVSEGKGTLISVVRGGIVKQKLQCPPGMKSEKGKCVLMTSKEKMGRIKSAKKASITRAKNAGANRINSAKMRKLSNKVRQQKSSLVSKTRPGG